MTAISENKTRREHDNLTEKLQFKIESCPSAHIHILHNYMLFDHRNYISHYILFNYYTCLQRFVFTHRQVK